MTQYAPSLMFEHALNAAKGWFQPTALDFQAKLSANVTFNPPAGRVAHLNAAGEFEMGMIARCMPLFLWNGINDFDVSNPGMTAGGHFVQQAIAPTGKMQSLVATGGYELESTEFDSENVYAPNDLLTATASNSNADTGGVLTNAGTGSHGNVKQFVDPCCGIVSRGSYNNEHGVAVVAFWPIVLPGTYV